MKKEDDRKGKKRKGKKRKGMGRKGVGRKEMKKREVVQEDYYHINTWLGLFELDVIKQNNFVFLTTIQSNKPAFSISLYNASRRRNYKI